jgi:hypothetical protein
LALWIVNTPSDTSDRCVIDIHGKTYTYWCEILALVACWIIQRESIWLFSLLNEHVRLIIRVSPFEDILDIVPEELLVTQWHCVARFGAFHLINCNMPYHDLT